MRKGGEGGSHSCVCPPWLKDGEHVSWREPPKIVHVEAFAPVFQVRGRNSRLGAQGQSVNPKENCLLFPGPRLPLSRTQLGSPEALLRWEGRH